MVRPRRQVRFTLPPGHRDHQGQPPGILRHPTGHLDAPGSPNRDPLRRSSLPDMRQSSRHLNERRVHTLEALCDMRSFLMHACNFDRDEHRRALTAPSIDGLSALISFVHALRGDIDQREIRRVERLLLHMNLDKSARHPHEQLAPRERPDVGAHEHNARRGHKKRLRREANYRLLELTSGILNINMRTLRDLASVQLEQRELDALKRRLQRFNARQDAVGLARPPIQSTSGYSSVPSSPADRRFTTAQSPHTDPLKMRTAYNIPGATFDELFPEQAGMAELQLGGSIAGTAPGSSAAATPLPPSMAQQPRELDPGSSPYAGPLRSPYGQPAAGTTYTPVQAAVHPQQTPPSAYMPYPPGAGRVVYPGTPPQPAYATPYAAAGPSSAYPSTPPLVPAAYPGATYPAQQGQAFPHMPAWPSPGGTTLQQPGGVPAPYIYNPQVVPPPPPHPAPAPPQAGPAYPPQRRY